MFRKPFVFTRNLVLALAAMAVTLFTPAALADTPNYSATTSVQIVPLVISGQYTATTTGVVQIKLPFKARLVGVSATARASGGTSPTLTVNVKQGASSVLSAPISITAGSVAEGSIASAQLADESTLTVDLTIGGTSPTWNDITVLLTLARN